MNLIMDYSSTTAILLFAQSERRVSTLKPIASSSKQNVLLWRKMNDHSVKISQHAKLPYFISNENDRNFIASEKGQIEIAKHIVAFISELK